MSTVDKVTYSFVKEEGNFLFRSKVNSFNLDHVTDKSIVSFYQNFSHYAALDTGLLPVDGTGLLAIRSAGNHTQVAYQYKPGMYYINWGSHEGDANAVSYLVAQPYRIVIIDFVDNNLLGARTFYSPIPATHPGVPLYHVNLPNINCKGYRGNGVGWICLYHNQDWSQMPFNERLARALERCSGIEVYNDANMSETDGPRFYSAHHNNNSDLTHIWNPREWEAKSQAEGFEWTLSEDTWIPITVKGRDDQGEHYTGSDAVPLTLGDAMVGKYNAYYSDSFHPKPINALTNPNLNLSESDVTNWFIKAYNASTTNFVGIDPYLQSKEAREKIASTILAQKSLLTSDETPSDDQEDGVMCTSCESHYDENESYSQNDEWWCSDCFHDNFTMCINTEEYLHNNDDTLFYDENTSENYDLSAFKQYDMCGSCNALHYIDHHIYNAQYSSTGHWQPNIWPVILNDQGGVTPASCSECIEIDDEDSSTCYICATNIPSVNSYDNALIVPVVYDDPFIHHTSDKTICNLCASKTYQSIMSYDHHNHYSFEFVSLAIPKTYVLSESDNSVPYTIVTDYMKQNDMEIHDQYLLTLSTAPLSQVDIVKGSSIPNAPIHLDDDPDTLYRTLKETAILSFEKMMNSYLFQNIITNSPQISLVPYTEPF